jgi:drug/metabolite transporter (DMT)-like permease
MDWYLLALGAVISFGICNILFKVGAELRANLWVINLFFYLGASIISIIIYLYKKNLLRISKFEVLIGLGIAVASFIGVSFLQSAFRKGLGALVSPMVSLNGVLVVIFSLLIYKEKVTLTQALGIILAFISIILMKWG